MEKVKVTPKTAEVIENSLKKYPKHQIVSNYDSISFRYREEMDLDTLIRALYIGYEVEPEFKVGDWVGFDDLTEEVGKIVHIVNARRIEAEITGYSVPQSIPINRIRHATPKEIKQEKERRWWKSHDREVWQIMSGDILRYKYSNPNKVSVVKNFKDGCVYFQNNEQDFVDELKNHYKVICFAENRLDINA